MGEFFHWVFIKDKIWNKKIVVKKLLKFLNLFTGKRSEYHLSQQLFELCLSSIPCKQYFFHPLIKIKKNH